ncbi:MAG: nucleotidyltransferase family protein [Synergistaceae bacterium]|nr:nucleotidyltransferase family protein [Synergistaceae bacterium]
MKTIIRDAQTAIGIIAEYNPFHNGHALHIQRAREALGAEVPVLVTLSSSFTQRGEPALADKWARTRMALLNGADLALELPFAFACNAAPEFARGAVDILAATGLVTHLSFGTERLFAAESPFSANENSNTILNILSEEPLSFKLNLKKNLKRGQSYPKAVAGALERELSSNVTPPLLAPNDILALAYILHLRRKKYDLIPLPVKRQGEGYHDLSPGKLASAAAIRQTLTAKKLLSESLTGWVREALPASSLAVLEDEEKRGRLCLGVENLWALLRGLLNRTSKEELRLCPGMDEGLENLFLKHSPRADSWEDFVGRCVCARYTRSRIQRQAIRFLTGADRWTALALSRRSPPYIRVLGYNQRGRKLLRLCGNTASAPVITRLGAVSDPIARAAADLEFRASRLRELLLPRPDLQYEERQKPISL